MTNLEANRQVVLQYVETFNRGDFAALRELFVPNCSRQLRFLNKVLPTTQAA
jgi:hypothetical protein